MRLKGRFHFPFPKIRSSVWLGRLCNFISHVKLLRIHMFSAGFYIHFYKNMSCACSGESWRWETQAHKFQHALFFPCTQINISVIFTYFSSWEYCICVQYVHSYYIEFFPFSFHILPIWRGYMHTFLNVLFLSTFFLKLTGKQINFREKKLQQNMHVLQRIIYSVKSVKSRRK